MFEGTVSHARPSAPRIGYVVKRFPRLSETFILNELIELEKRVEAPVELYALAEAGDAVRHAALAQLRARVSYLPGDDAVRTLSLRTGCFAGERFADRPLRKIGRGLADPLFPGKTANEAKLLMLQAAALAGASWASGVRHLHAHFATDAATVAMLASRLSGVPYSFTAHAKDIFHIYTDRDADAEFLAEKIAGARFVVTVSRYNQRYLQELVGPRHAGKIRHIYNGIDLDKLAPSGAARERAVILGVGRLVEKKGFDDLIGACRLLASRGVPFRCMIVGDGPKRDALARAIEHLGLKDRVALVPPMAHEALLDAMAQASVLAAPCKVSASGDRDGLPTVLLEALATGLPAVSTSVAGIPEIIDSGTSGLLVQPSDPEALAEALATILTDPRLQSRLARAGRIKAERDFDITRNVAALHALMTQSLAESAASGGSVDEDRLRYG
jgi:colanic acid/amylovoran biosynthesis glycosyltransferase